MWQLFHPQNQEERPIRRFAEVLHNPSYSSELAPTDFYFFQYLDIILADKKIEYQKVKMEFVGFRTPDFFKKGIDKLPLRWQHERIFFL